MRGTRVAVILALVLLIPALPIVGAEQEGDRSFIDLASAIGEAEDGEVITIHAVEGTDSPFPTSVTVDVPNLTICKGQATPDKSADIRLHTDAEPSSVCSEEAPTPILDASGEGPYVLNIAVPGVTVQGLELRWTLDVPQDLSTATEPTGTLGQATSTGLTGVIVNAEGVTLKDDEIRLRTGPCSPQQVACQSAVPGIGVFLTSAATDATVAGNVIEVSLDADDGTVSGLEGIRAVSDDYVIADNELRYWTGAAVRVVPGGDGGTDTTRLITRNTFGSNPAYGVLVEGASSENAPVIETNDFLVIETETTFVTALAPVAIQDSEGVDVLRNVIQYPPNPGGSGVLLQGSDGIDLTGNHFTVFDAAPLRNQPGVAVTISSAVSPMEGGPYTDIVLRGNLFEMAETPERHIALQITADVQASTIDARLNDWDTYTWGSVTNRVLDQGITNEVLVLPFLLANE